MRLHVGQSWDIEWRESVTCPSETEYFRMVDLSTLGRRFWMFGYTLTD